MIDPDALGDAITAKGRVARIVIAGHKGSTPRETGTSMIVFDGGTQGTIGGGRLEYDAVRRARGALLDGSASVLRQALGPELGQCCGGSVTLVTEVWDAAILQAAVETVRSDASGFLVRRVEGNARRPEAGRMRLTAGSTRLVDGWLVEQVRAERQQVFVYGAGHVGRALAAVLAPMPQIAVHVVDSREDLLAELPEAAIGHAGAPQGVMAAASPGAAHFIMTPDHALDFELCHCLLGLRFSYGGLIGSATKWARFRRRLAALGHPPARIDQIECPIGDPSLGKQPQAIAIGVAARVLARQGMFSAREDVA